MCNVGSQSPGSKVLELDLKGDHRDQERLQLRHLWALAQSVFRHMVDVLGSGGMLEASRKPDLQASTNG